MAASSPQQRAFGRELHTNRIAALRGDSLSIPTLGENTNILSDKEANNNRFYDQQSEDNILAQYPLASPFAAGGIDTSLSDPRDFARTQQQNRIEQGINAPQFLPPAYTDLPDPDLSTPEQTITYEESVQDLADQVAQAEDFETAQQARSAFRNKINQAANEGLQRGAELIKEKTSRYTAKLAGDGSNLADMVGWDGFITFTISYIYLCARACISLLSPERKDMSFSQKALHTIIPPFRPIREPVDFLYFIFSTVMVSIVVSSLFIVAVVVFYFVLFPIFSQLFSP